MEAKPIYYYSKDCYCRRSINRYNYSLMLRTILILVYFGINLLLIGISMGLNRGLPSKKETFIYIVMLLVALPFAIVVYIWNYWIKAISNYFMIDFYWSFYFTKEWTNLQLSTLQKINSLLYDDRYSRDNVNNRIYRHSANLVFKRNSFEPVEYKTGLEWLETIPKTYQVKVISPDAWINDTDFIKTRITKKQFVQNMKTSAISHAITFEIDKF